MEHVRSILALEKIAEQLERLADIQECSMRFQLASEQKGDKSVSEILE